MREVVRRDLVALGFSVIEAGNGDEALPLLENVDAIYLLISDIVMPGTCNGIELARRAVTLRPGLPVVLITGYAEQASPQAGDGAFQLLRKPFGKIELRDTIAVAITAPPVEVSA